MKRTNHKFTLQQKLAALERQKQHGLNFAAKEVGVVTSVLNNWRKQFAAGTLKGTPGALETPATKTTRQPGHSYSEAT